MFSKYYQSELSFLRETGKAFARAHPTLAGLLAERGGDPDVERLLEGFAFLTARIRERIESAVPEISHGLIELLVPQYLRPVPGCAIVELSPQIRALRTGIQVAAGAELASTPVDGTSCRFRTTDDVLLLPLTLPNVTLDSAPAGGATLRLTLHAPESGKVGVFAADRLRFHLHGELPTSSLLFLFLNRHLTGLSVRSEGETGPGIALPKDSFVPVGLEKSGGLFPVPPTATPGHVSLLEYFTLPQRFLFFEVRGLAPLAERVNEKFELLLHLDRMPVLPGRLPKDAVKLHCVPVVNLFAGTADPLRHELPGQSLFVRAAGVNPLHMEVYSVDHVEGLRPGGVRVEHAPFSQFAHLRADAGAPFYLLTRTRSPLDGFSDTSLALATAVGDAQRPQITAPGGGPGPYDETISVDLTCTNRGLPGRLGLGDIKVPTSSSPTLATFRNITAVTQPVPPPLGQELHWQLLSHLALNQRSLSQVETLRALLGLYNFQVRADQTQARANALRAEALLSLEVAPARRFFEGAPVRGMRTTVSIDETRLAGPGDAFLLGHVLDELFASAVTLNAFSELVLKLSPSQSHYAWTARNGSRTLL